MRFHWQCHFNPLFPYGKRPCYNPLGPEVLLFQSTLPIREETLIAHKVNDLFLFQSTLPIREETCSPRCPRRSCAYFNPLFPYGKRRPLHLEPRQRRNFNPLFPYGKRHAEPAQKAGTPVFQSTLPIREETTKAAAL